MFHPIACGGALFCGASGGSPGGADVAQSVLPLCVGSWLEVQALLNRRRYARVSALFMVAANNAGFDARVLGEV